MAEIINLAAWCPPGVAARIAAWADRRRIYIDLTADGDLRCVPDRGEALVLHMPDLVSLKAVALAVARRTGHRYVDVMRDAATGLEWRAELVA